ncbi:MAG: isochorismate synthase [Chloroflexota bacterium]|nr:isochorismate synthase [Chloroflexota bacterium]
MATLYTQHRQPSTASWLRSYDRKQLYTSLETASTKAQQLGHEVLVSYTLPLAWYGTIHLFSSARQANLGDVFFWERPDEHITFVGIGAATAIATEGATRFTDAASAWQTLLKNAVIMDIEKKLPHSIHGPLLFGGFAFDPLAQSTGLWEGFPAGLLILPSLLFTCIDNQATLTLNTIVQPFEDVTECMEEITARVEHLQSAVENNASFSPAGNARKRHQFSLQNMLPASQWMNLVDEAVKDIQEGKYEKVVLARGVQATPIEAHEEIFDIATILYRLRQSNPKAYLFALQRGERYFVGATPERLVRAQDGQIQTIALAGSAARGRTLEEDTRLGEELLHCVKNQGEHEIVVVTVREALSHLCTDVRIANELHLLKLKNVQHLETSIVAELLPGRSILEVVAELHPTPAVGGFPRAVALEAIRAGEQLDRGWYAGPIGWIDAHGNGEFAVALRSAILHTDQATLFAGCGIVAGSDPRSEYEETCLKLQVMLRGLGSED